MNNNYPKVKTNVFNNKPAKALIKYLSAIIAILILVLTMLPIGVSAEEYDPDANSAAFAVKANLPKNQEGAYSYFNLRMKPEEKQVLSVDVFSLSNEDHTIYVNPTNGYTNSNGEIDYSRSDTLLSTDHSFTSLVDLADNEFLLPANETVTIDIPITMPDKEFDGSILGGIQFLRKTENNNTQEGAVLYNDFAYLVGVVLFENDNVPTSNFELLAVSPDVQNYRTSFVSDIVNKSSKMEKGMNLSVDIFRDGELYLTHKNENISFAPNSQMDYSMPLENYSFEKGSYTAKIHLENSADKAWNFEYSFEIDSTLLKSLNKKMEAPQADGVTEISSPVTELMATWMSDESLVWTPEWMPETMSRWMPVIYLGAILLLVILVIVVATLLVKSSRKKKSLKHRQ